MKLTLTVCLTFIFSFTTLAQTPSPTPNPKIDDDKDVVKISTTLIQIDATVTDKKGNIVKDLKPEDFEIYENGKKQEITNFSFISLPQTKQDSSTDQIANPNETIKIPLPPIKLKPENVRRTYAIVVDDLGLSFSSVYRIRNDLKKFINEQMQDTDLVAIVRTGTGIGALQSFTSDKRLLLAAIEKIIWNASGRVGINSFASIEPSLKEEMNGTKKQDGSIRVIEGLKEETEIKNQINDSERQAFTVGTLGALRWIIRGMRDLPGRKSIMLLSEGFQIYNNNIGVNANEPNGIFDSLRAIGDLANRSSINIYTIDPRGLMNPQFATAQDIIGVFDAAADAKRNRRSDLFRNTQESLVFLAEATGGTAYLNQNGVDLGLQKAANDQESYYLIAYQPNEDTFDEKKNRFNKLQIKVKRPELKVRYRSGFFAYADDNANKTSPSPQRKLLDALVSPFGKNDINLSLYPIFYNDSKNRNFIRSLVHIDTKDLNFTPDSNGIYKATFEIASSIYDSNGVSANNGINQVTLQFDKEKFQRVQKEGIIYNLAIPIVKTGAYQFHVALQDSSTGKIGSASQYVEVPNLDKKKLSLSNLIVKNYSIEKWKAITSGQNNISSPQDTNVFLDTAVREFKRGTQLSYFFIIYNAKRNDSQNISLQMLTRLFYNGKLISQGNWVPLNVNDQPDQQRIEISNSITLGTDLQTGDYVFQTIVINDAGKDKRQIAAQSIDFKIVD